jgi:5-methylcytosine-specific restriction protein A
MATYLFTWNPARWDWPSLPDHIAEIRKTGRCRERWGCAATKKIRPGDRAFLIKLGVEPRGLMASGWAASEVYEDAHWRADQQRQGNLTRYVDIDWETLLDPTLYLFPRAWLASPVYAPMHWEPRASGVRIPDRVAEHLEQDWAKFLAGLAENYGQLQTASG